MNIPINRAKEYKEYEFSFRRKGTELQGYWVGVLFRKMGVGVNSTMFVGLQWSHL